MLLNQLGGVLSQLAKSTQFRLTLIRDTKLRVKNTPRLINLCAFIKEKINRN